MSNVDIRFIGEVEKVIESPRSDKLLLKIDDGSKFGGRAAVWVLRGAFAQGATVEVVAHEMPYADKPWQTRDGEWKAGGVTYGDARVSALDMEDTDGEEIPF